MTEDSNQTSTTEATIENTEVNPEEGTLTITMSDGETFEFSLEDIARYESRQANSNKSSSEYGSPSLGYRNNRNRFYNMSLHKPVGEEMTEEEAEGLEGKIDQMVSQGRLPKKVKEGGIYKNPHLAKESLNFLNEALKTYYSDPNQYQAQQRFYARKGRKIRRPKRIGIYDDANAQGAVARTDTQELLEANYNFEESVSHLMSNAGFKFKDMAIEYVITHEMAHNTQSNKILKSHPQPYIAELDADLQCAEIFKERANAAKDPATRERYLEMTQYALARYAGVYAAMVNGTGYGSAAHKADLARRNNLKSLLETGKSYVPLGAENVIPFARESLVYMTNRYAQNREQNQIGMNSSKSYTGPIGLRKAS